MLTHGFMNQAQPGMGDKQAPVTWTNGTPESCEATSQLIANLSNFFPSICPMPAVYSTHPTCLEKNYSRNLLSLLRCRHRLTMFLHSCWEHEQ